MYKQLYDNVLYFILTDPFLFYCNQYLYVQWYGKPHAAVELQLEAVYGLPEVSALCNPFFPFFHFPIFLGMVYFSNNFCML